MVYGKRSLLDKMPGDRWRKFANLRALYAYMWARPGKKMLFMGGEFGQWHEWNHDASLDWHLLEEADHHGLQSLVRDLNRLYRAEPALWEARYRSQGLSNGSTPTMLTRTSLRSCASRRRRAAGLSACATSRRWCASPIASARRSAVLYQEILNSDAAIYGGSNVGNAGAVMADNSPSHGMPFSLTLRLPPLGVLWLEVPR